MRGALKAREAALLSRFQCLDTIARTISGRAHADTIAERWKIASNFFPEIGRHHARLERLSAHLADEFQRHLLQCQQYADAAAIAQPRRG